MNIHTSRKSQRGQIMIFVAIALSLVLLGFVAMATDYTNFWFKRQAVQGAADAACQAGALDLKLYATGAPNTSNFSPTNGAFACSSNLTAAPCVISKFNGIDPALAANTINVSFPTAGACTAFTGVTYPCIQVDIEHDVTRTLSAFLSGSSVQKVGGHATCGLVSAPGPVPIVVLHPTAPTGVTTQTNHPNAIYMAGTQNAITIVGGPQVSVQVNSNDPNAVTTGSLATVDLSHAWAPNNTGGDFATFGGQATKPPTGVSLGSTGHWQYPRTPIPDPYRLYNAPAKPAAGVKTAAIKGSANCPTGTSSDPIGCYKRDGCFDPGGCDEYTPGYYSGSIQVKNGSAVFQPGLYYLDSGLDMNSNSYARVTCCGGAADGDGSGGVMFYFHGANSDLNITSNSGTPGKLADVYFVAGGTHNGIQSRALQCPGGGTNPGQIPATIDGNSLLGPCTGTYRDPSGQYRGFLYFHDRAFASFPSWQGGGNTLASGFMYFHQCNSAGTGVNCTLPPGANSFGSVFNLGGNASSGSYTLGSIVTDRIVTNGNPGITMILSPFNAFPILYVEMFH